MHLTYLVPQLKRATGARSDIFCGRYWGLLSHEASYAEPLV